jgi:hypothetical protein
MRTPNEIESQLSVLKKERKTLEQQCDAARQKELAMMRELAESKFGAVLGAVVTNRKGDEFRICRVDVVTWYGDRPWVKGNPKREDGTFGKAIRNLYSDWTAK